MAEGIVEAADLAVVQENLKCVRTANIPQGSNSTCGGAMSM